MIDKIDISLVGHGYTLEEAVKLMYQEVMKKEDKTKPKTIENIGLVLGILSLNDEIELVVQFMGSVDSMRQLTKHEFEKSLIVVTED